MQAAEHCNAEAVFGPASGTEVPGNLAFGLSGVKGET